MRDGRKKKGDGKHIDHKVPLDAGGSTAKSNTRVVSAKVNKGWRKTRPSMYTKRKVKNVSVARQTSVDTEKQKSRSYS